MSNLNASISALTNGMLRLNMGAWRGNETSADESNANGGGTEENTPTSIDILPMPQTSIQKFDPQSSKWKVYKERLEDYFSSLKCTDDTTKKTTLLNCLNDEAYNTLRNECVPSAKSYDEICKILQKFYVPYVDVWRERIKFHSMSRNNGESTVVWLNRIRQAASDCEYGNRLNDVLLDKFVIGLTAKALDRLSEEKISELTLEKAVDVAIKYERSSSSDDVHFVDKKSSNTSSQKRVRCKHCGNKNHIADVCKFRTAKCHKCSAVGHIANVCKKSQDNVNTLFGGSDSGKVLNVSEFCEKSLF